MASDSYAYPALLSTSDGRVCVEFPDLPGCITFGDNVTHAIWMAKEALELHLWGMEDDGDPIPEPTDFGRLPIEPGSIPVMIDVYMPPVRDEMANKAVKKTLSIPRWLNDLAEKQGVNFSGTLQTALKKQLGVLDPPSPTKQRRGAR